jgi:DNA-binding CsgD family transcriptional regulator
MKTLRDTSRILVCVAAALLCVVLAVSLTVFTAAKADVVLSPSELFDGEGTAASPFLITTLTDLNNMRPFSADNYHWLLAGDLSLNYKPSVDDEEYLAHGFLPIGSGTGGFVGTFDGGGHTITELYINRPSTNWVGLFSTVSAKMELNMANYTFVTIARSVVKNLNVKLGVRGITARRGVGGIAGNIVDSDIVNCSVTGDIFSTWTSAMDVATGINFGEVGGIVGHATSGVELDNCMYYGNLTGALGVGGIVGNLQHNFSLTNCVAGGTIMLTSGSTFLAEETVSGGIAGNVFFNSDPVLNYSGSISNCYSDFAATDSRVAGIYGATSFVSTDFMAPPVMENCYYNALGGIKAATFSGQALPESCGAATPSEVYPGKLDFTATFGVSAEGKIVLQSFGNLAADPETILRDDESNVRENNEGYMAALRLYLPLGIGIGIAIALVAVAVVVLIRVTKQKAETPLENGAEEVALSGVTSQNDSKVEVQYSDSELSEVYDSFTDKEKIVAEYILAGLRRKEISEKMRTSEASIKYYIGNILTKANCSSRLDFVTKYAGFRKG